MLNKLKDLSLGKKVVLFLLPFFIVVFLLLFTRILEKIDLVQEMSSVQELDRLTLSISNLVHELQKERGVTSGFLGGQKKAYETELPLQRSLTDKMLEAFKLAYKPFAIEDISSSLKSQLKKSFDELEELKQLRKRVDVQNISVANSIAYFSDLNALLLDNIFRIVKLDKHKEITSLTLAYANFLEAKENAGIERAVVAEALSRGKMEQKTFNRFISLVTRQEALFGSFLKFTNKSSRARG